MSDEEVRVYRDGAKIVIALRTDEDREWHGYKLDIPTALNFARRIGTVVEGENDRLSKRGA